MSKIPDGEFIPTKISSNDSLSPSRVPVYTTTVNDQKQDFPKLNGRVTVKWGSTEDTQYFWRSPLIQYDQIEKVT